MNRSSRYRPESNLDLLAVGRTTRSRATMDGSMEMVAVRFRRPGETQWYRLPREVKLPEGPIAATRLAGDYGYETQILRSCHPEYRSADPEYTPWLEGPPSTATGPNGR